MSKKTKKKVKVPPVPKHSFHGYENRAKSKRIGMRVSPNFMYVVGELLKIENKDRSWNKITATDIIESAVKELAVKKKVITADQEGYL